MELAVAALSSLLPKLAALLTDEYKLQKGVRGEIKFLQSEMESFQAALNRVSKLPPQQIHDLHNIWVRDLKELSYDIEDSVDSFTLRVDAPRSAKPKNFRRFFDRAVRLLTKDIKSRIREIADRQERYKFPEVALQPENTEIDPRLSPLYEDAKNLVGIEGPAKKLTTMLTHGKGAQEQQLKVVSIVGVGGLGKTTLANTVYQRLREDFQAQAFVSVSIKPDINKIFSSILRQVSEHQYPNAEAWNQTKVTDTIRQVLEKKRYIIVIDDVWAESAWTQIKCALIENNLGSRVILTTRNADVAKFCCSPIDGTMCELDPLSYENSKKLLCTRVFNKNEEMHSELEEVSRKILEKCGGIPLAIITIASLLASRPNKTKYEWYGVYSSMGSGLHNGLDNMRRILYLSYSDLPSYLKPCLLYLSMFPDDYEIASDDLVRLWIAEGFIDEKQGSNLYDLGEMYLNELANRSMIQPIYDEYGSPRACRVHYMVLDLIMFISAQENFVTILEDPCHISSACNIRRLSLRGSRNSSNEGRMIFPETVNTSHVRSIVAFGNAHEWLPPMSRFPVLRVLALKSTCDLSPGLSLKNLGSLFYLKYLGLGNTLVALIPEEVGNLQFLQTLSVTCNEIANLPSTIVRLKQLTCLHIGIYDSADIDVLCSLTELRVLDISCHTECMDSLETSLVHCLAKLQKVQNLSIWVASGECKLDALVVPQHLCRLSLHDCWFSTLPDWVKPSFLKNLSFISVSVIELQKNDLESLGKLPVLCYLNLKVDHENLGILGGFVIGAGLFQCLVSCVFWGFRGAMIYTQGTMPRLTSLQFTLHVRDMREIAGGSDSGYNLGIENLLSLQDVTVLFRCGGANNQEVQQVKTALRHATKIHPNNPAIDFIGYKDKEEMGDDIRHIIRS